MLLATIMIESAASFKMPQELSYELVAKVTCKRGKPDHSNSRLHFLFIWVILMATHLPPSSAYHHLHDPPPPSARKLLFFKPESLHFHPAARSRSPGLINYDLYDEDKRMVHTGPNPLHN